jgi:hypothetical protein
MRLSEERIDFINRQILKSLLEEGLIAIDGRESAVLIEMNRTLLEDLSFEDKLDEEVAAMIRGMRRTIPEGSPEWNSIFLQKKEELAARHRYIL